MTVVVRAGGADLQGDLTVTDAPRGLVVFAHGSGSSRRSPRNRFVAEELRRAGLATLLMDLLTPDEEAEDARTRRLRFDVEMLGERVVAALDWLGARDDVAELAVGAFGASTGAAAARIAAAQRPERVAAVVSRGGRPDLAGAALELVRAPTLLLVGDRDTQVVDLNRQAMARMRAPTQLDLVAGASHLFEEPGTLERVADLAAQWFLQHSNLR
jgi:putative phosphoribosyl transferase